MRFNHLILYVLMLISSACSGALEPAATAVPPTTTSQHSPPAIESASFTQGLAATIRPELLSCKGGRTAALGRIESEDGRSWIVPTEINNRLPDSFDLLNPCTNIVHSSLADVDLDAVPVIEIDPDGTIVTGYLFADNYFELYVNGTPVVKDAVPFTPFNSHVVRFKANYPMTYAMKAVDWEEHLGLGTEDNKGNPYHPGDAGIVATFSDGTVTSDQWKAQSFYIAPLMSKTDLIIEERGGRTVRSTPYASTTPTCATDCYAAHFAIPNDWYAVDFDDASWPQAVAYDTAAVGVDNKKEYTNFSSEFSKGTFIWTANLILDNEIILRYTVDRRSE